MPTKLRITVPTSQSQEEGPDSKEDVTKSDSEPHPSPSPASKKAPRSSTKRKAAKSASAASSPTSPLVTSSSAATPPPDPGSKRKGGNKRKFTHEYCLTCTRYGRACGGRRDNEEGCAVCRDPDRSKGEKLRECLWADSENGINDYKTARELFKKAQAEARALRAKPHTVKRQRSDTTLLQPTVSYYHNTTSDISLPTGPLPQTSKPLNLLPPTTSGSGYVSQQARYAQKYGTEPENAEDSENATQPLTTDTTQDQAPRIHRPQLTYIRVGSENGEYTIASAQPPRLILPPQYRINGSHETGPYHWDTEFQSWQRTQIPFSYQRASSYYAHPYRSAYDAPPAPPSNLRSSSHQFMPLSSPAFDARTPRSPPSLPLDKSGTPPRKWSTSSRKITTIDGTEWRAKAWKPVDDSSNVGFSEDAMGPKQSDTVPIEGTSDTSSLSTCLSMDGDIADDSAVTKTGNKLRLRLGNHVNQSASKKPNTFTFPGEITIEDEEEDGASSSDDAELSSDESKHKTLPAKLRKILSRSRVTKVIIEGDVFEVRPRNMISSSKIQKKSSNSDDTSRHGSRGKPQRKDHRRVSQLHSAKNGHGTDEQDHDGVPASQSKARDSPNKPAPIKIKLIFNRKAAVVSPERTQGERTSNTADQVVGTPLTPADDNDMDRSWRRTP